MLVARGARQLPVVGVAFDDVLCGPEHPLAKVEELIAAGVERAGHGMSSSPDDSLRSASSIVRRSSSTSLSRDVWPDTIRTSRGERRRGGGARRGAPACARPPSGG